jgi:hypothetical protein
MRTVCEDLRIVDREAWAGTIAGPKSRSAGASWADPSHARGAGGRVAQVPSKGGRRSRESDGCIVGSVRESISHRPRRVFQGGATAKRGTWQARQHVGANCSATVDRDSAESQAATWQVEGALRLQASRRIRSEPADGPCSASYVTAWPGSGASGQASESRRRRCDGVVDHRDRETDDDARRHLRDEHPRCRPSQGERCGRSVRRASC